MRDQKLVFNQDLWMLQLLVLLHSSGARVNGEAGISTTALLRKVTGLRRSVRLELETQTRG